MQKSPSVRGSLRLRISGDNELSGCCGKILPVCLEERASLSQA